ncbi:MAG: PKD-like family lipoprotein [Odoribacter sp.]
MKVKHIILGMGCLLFLISQHSCIDDRGSFAFQSGEEMMPVKITEMKDTTVDIMENLKIEPEITGLEEGREYSYLWYAASSVTAGVAPQRDTLSQERNMDFTVKYESGTYNLVFEVRDVEHNIYARTQLLMTVASKFAYGWYVLKEEANKTDIDFVLPDGTVKSNVIRTLGMEPLDGKPMALGYQPQRYYHQIDNSDGTVTTLANKKAIFVLSGNDLRILNADNMSVFKPSFSECFYEPPLEKRPQNIHTAYGDAYLINAGKMYSIYGMSRNIGKFPYAKAGVYDLHNDLVGSIFGDVTVWDKMSRTFFYTSSAGATLNKFSDQTNAESPIQISPSDMSLELIRLLKRGDNYPPKGYAIMKNSDKEEYYLADMTMSGYPFQSFDTLPTHCKMPKADVMAAHGMSACIYFAKGSELSVYRQIESSDREAVIKTFPGETISFIGNIRSTNKKDKFNHLVVVTNNADGWKLYRFEIIGETPDIKTEPLKVYSGKGIATYAMFRI